MSVASPRVLGILSACVLPLLTGPLAGSLAAQSVDTAVHRGDGRAVVELRHIVTDRDSPADLPLPDEEDAFLIAVFGDRTGGPADGVKILAEAVADVNLLEPDLVMTVGDLIQGYNTTVPWLAQMLQFRLIMDQLLCPWFPVAGNHDVYWRGDARPVGEHEANYETHFGPLWYAFEHKHTWFVVLYTDEGDPETGEKNFSKPASQRMSPEQFAWLDSVLERASDADHVLVFLHHPRWLGGGYGDDWDRVHARLLAAGNVSAVFAGHIHHMRYDPIDGLEYFTLATVGGGQAGDLPEAGYLHQYHLVTVRPDRLSVAAYPVGTAIDPREVTGDVAEDARTLASSWKPELSTLAMESDLSVDGTLEVTVTNPARRAIEVGLGPEGGDVAWTFDPDHVHARLDPGASETLRFRSWRSKGLAESLAVPDLVLDCDYLGDGLRVPIPQKRLGLRLAVDSLPRARGDVPDTALRLDGSGDWVDVDHALLDLPDGPFTVEGWVHANTFRSRQGFLNKTQQAEFGVFLDGGRPAFLVHLDGRYAEAVAPEPMLETGRWHHVAGVFDGEQVRLYVDGQRVASHAASGARRISPLPFLIGADPDGAGGGVDALDGAIDEVRISSTARYDGPSFRLTARHLPDRDTVLLLHMDEGLGPWVLDASPRQIHGTRVGEARLGERP